MSETDNNITSKDELESATEVPQDTKVEGNKETGQTRLVRNLGATNLLQEGQKLQIPVSQKIQAGYYHRYVKLLL